MDMKIDTQRIRSERAKRAWSQEHLAEAAGLGLRTIHRIEKSGTASLESVKALAAVLELDIETLVVGENPVCEMQDVGKATQWAVAAYAVLKIIAFGAVMLDIVYSRLLLAAQPAEVTVPVFAAVADSLVSLSVWVGIAFLAALVTAWQVKNVRNLLLASLVLYIGVPLTLVAFVDVTQDVSTAGAFLRIVLHGITLWLALLAAWKVLRFPQAATAR